MTMTSAGCATHRVRETDENAAIQARRQAEIRKWADSSLDITYTLGHFRRKIHMESQGSQVVAQLFLDHTILKQNAVDPSQYREFMNKVEEFIRQKRIPSSQTEAETEPGLTPAASPVATPALTAATPSAATAPVGARTMASPSGGAGTTLAASSLTHAAAIPLTTTSTPDSSTILIGCRAPFTVTLRSGKATQVVNGCRSSEKNSFSHLVKDSEFLIYSQR